MTPELRTVSPVSDRAGNGTVTMAVVGLASAPETFLKRLFLGLLERGVRVVVVGSSRPDADLGAAGVEWFAVPPWKGNRARRLLAVAAGMVRARLAAPDDWRVLARHVRAFPSASARMKARHRWLPFAGRRWDVVYFPWNSVVESFGPLFELGMPVVISCRGAQVNVAPHNPERADIAGALRIGFERAAAVHCVSRAILEEACGFGLDRRKAEVIPPAVDPSVFRPADRPAGGQGPLRIVSTGSLIWRKGYEYGVAALHRLLRSGVDALLEIIGEGPERTRILYTARDLGVPDKVVLLGKLRPDDVRERLRSADLFLLPSLSEGISNAALEAMACGLPIVTTDCGGMREAVDDGVEGFVVPARDPEAMASALAALAADTPRRRAMGRAARNRVETDFDLRDQLDAFASLIRRVAQQHDEAATVRA